MLQDPIHMFSVDQMPSCGVTAHSCLSPQRMWGMLLGCLLIEARTFRKPRACTENWNQGSIFLDHLVKSLANYLKKGEARQLLGNKTGLFPLMSMFRRYKCKQASDKLWNHWPTYVLSEERNWAPAIHLNDGKLGWCLGARLVSY